MVSNWFDFGFTTRNSPRSIYQYSDMAPRLSGETSIFGVVFFVSKSLFEIDRQKKPKKFTILTRKPRSQVRILIYRTWAIQNRSKTYKHTNQSNCLIVFDTQLKNALCVDGWRAWNLNWPIRIQQAGKTSLSWRNAVNRKGIEIKTLFSLEMALNIHKEGFSIPKTRSDCIKWIEVKTTIHVVSLSFELAPKMDRRCPARQLARSLTSVASRWVNSCVIFNKT